MEILAIILWVATVIGYIIWNLYQKNKKMEDALVEKNRYITYIKELGVELDFIVHKIDTTMWVQSDQELVSLFETIKALSAVIKGVDSNDGK